MGFIQLIRQLVAIFFAVHKAKKNLDRAMRADMLDPMMQAYRMGDYEKAKTLTADPFMQAEMLMELDRTVEAEQILRQLAQTEKEAKPRTLVMSELGQLLMRQQRYDEAMECFQLALRMWPERGSTYRAIAEWWLRRGDNPAEALRYARLALQKEKSGPGLSEDSKSININEEMGTLAWAIAVNSRDGEEVDRLCEEIAFPGLTPACSLAMSHFQFGKAWAAIGDEAHSAAHFGAAARTDPKGYWGRQAAAMAVANRT
jgi:tetratricopeptide (TPR) repeat protein